MRRPGRKKEPQRQHMHFMCTCGSCGLQFEICGIPCFIFCPGCQAMLIIKQPRA